MCVSVCIYTSAHNMLTGFWILIISITKNVVESAYTEYVIMLCCNILCYVIYYTIFRNVNNCKWYCACTNHASSFKYSDK